MTDRPTALVLHGGAGCVEGRDYSAECRHMRETAERARDRLHAGASALDVVTEAIEALEASGLYVAGRGSSPNLDGDYELDASLMTGWNADAGAVAALQGFQSPIRAARAVMEDTPHVMLAGQGASAFAASKGLARIDDPDAWFTRAGQGERNHAPGALAHGTVGCVALDAEGRLVAGTSTGGVFGKMPGRLGDTPVIGSGTWADDHVAVSATGTGEVFIRTAAAARVAFLVKLAGRSLEQATQEAIDEIGRLQGDGGLIAVDRRGNVAFPYNSPGMKRAIVRPDGSVESLAFAA